MIEKYFDDGLLHLGLIDTITQADILGLKQTFEAAFESHSTVSILLDLTQWGDVTADAIREDIGMELSLLGKLGQIERIAFVSEKAWVEAMVNGVGPWLPGVELKRFDDAEAAELWAHPGPRSDM